MARGAPRQNVVDQLAGVFDRLCDGLRTAGLMPRRSVVVREVAEPRVPGAPSRWLAERTRAMQERRAQVAMPVDMQVDRFAGEERRGQVMRDRVHAMNRFLARRSCEEEADRKSKALLLHMLSPAQRAQFERESCFAVHVKRRGRFIVKAASSFNVVGPNATTYCARTEPPVPIYDLMLVQKILLEADPDRFFRVANRDRP